MLYRGLWRLIYLYLPRLVQQGSVGRETVLAARLRALTGETMVPVSYQRYA